MRYRITEENINELFLRYDFKNENNKLCSEMIFDKPELGKVWLRDYHSKGAFLMEWKSVFYRPVQIKGCNDEGGISICFNLGDRVQGEINNKKIDLKSKSCNIWTFSEGGKGKGYYNTKEESHSFIIVFNELYLKNFVERYPDLFSEIYKGYMRCSFKRHHNQDVPINAEINQTLHKIQNANLIGKYRSEYIEAKFIELLILQLNYSSKKDSCDKKFCKSSSDVDKIYEARNILLQDIENPPGIYELSRKTGVDEKKLKYGFKEVFNQTVYGCLFEYKMSLAQQLLLDTNKSVYEIAQDCGYDYTSHFTTAFKRRFGVSPNVFRKN